MTSRADEGERGSRNQVHGTFVYGSRAWQTIPLLATAAHPKSDDRNPAPMGDWAAVHESGARRAWQASASDRRHRSLLDAG